MFRTTRVRLAASAPGFTASTTLYDLLAAGALIEPNVDYDVPFLPVVTAISPRPPLPGGGPSAAPETP